MIYGKIWLVVKPTTGIPVFLAGVALSSFAVHTMLVTQTTWVKQFLNGSAAVVATAPVDATASPTVALVAPAAPKTP
jgi:light-harvesting protein B-800-850 alpha chain